MRICSSMSLYYVGEKEKEKHIGMYCRAVDVKEKNRQKLVLHTFKGVRT